MKQILVIDDDKRVNAMLSDTLQEAGYAVTSAFNGKMVATMLKTECFDLIITDLVMPEVEGIELIKSVRTKNWHLPIIAISGGGMLHPDGYLEIAHSLGADHVFKKPLDMELFLDTVRWCVEK